jgi:uncharacterized protein (TIGR00725 family)
MAKTLIAVVGAGQATPEQAALAERAGRAVAQAGAVLVCGGLGGCMAAACKGAHAGGGLTLGFLPSNDPETANPDVDLVIPTNMGVMRNVLIDLAADAVVAIDGGLGTLSEIAIALQHRKPVFGLDTWQVDPARSGSAQVVSCASPEEAVAKALAACR